MLWRSTLKQEWPQMKESRVRIKELIDDVGVGFL